MDQSGNANNSDVPQVVVEINLVVISPEALLKTCHWFSLDFACEIRNRTEYMADVLLTARHAVPASDLAAAREAFNTSAMDFALREKIETKTSGIRDLLLAKAFSESGVLEDRPDGVFGDKVEEEKADGIFKILNNRQH